MALSENVLRPGKVFRRTNRKSRYKIQAFQSISFEHSSECDMFVHDCVSVLSERFSISGTVWNALPRIYCLKMLQYINRLLNLSSAPGLACKTLKGTRGSGLRGLRRMWGLRVTLL